MSKVKKNLNDLLKEINEIEQKSDPDFSRNIERQIKENEKQLKEDNLQDIQTHKEMINSHIMR